jgi:hypothetical protein
MLPAASGLGPIPDGPEQYSTSSELRPAANKHAAASSRLLPGRQQLHDYGVSLLSAPSRRSFSSSYYEAAELPDGFPEAAFREECLH